MTQRGPTVAPTHAPCSCRGDARRERKCAPARFLPYLTSSNEWIAWSHLIPWHGRRVCSARKPACDTCAVADICPKLL